MTKHFSIAFIGDTHGENAAAVKRVLSLDPQPTIALHVGDFDAEDPLPSLYQGLDKAGIDFQWIHGNHDVDREHWYDNTLGSAWSSRCLHARVIDHHGIKIAGLGGHFVEKVWHPELGAPRFASRRDCLANCGKGNRWRDGLPRKLRGAIWWEDIERLWDQKADILITHEAPPPHPYGFSVIAELAEAMGVKLIVHGHHHESFEGITDNGITVVGLARSEVRTWTLEQLTAKATRSLYERMGDCDRQSTLSQASNEPEKTADAAVDQSRVRDAIENILTAEKPTLSDDELTRAKGCERK